MNLDQILSTMMRVAPRVSDVNFTVGLPPLVESDGKLIPAVDDGERSRLTAERTLQVADGTLRHSQVLPRQLQVGVVVGGVAATYLDD